MRKRLLPSLVLGAATLSCAPSPSAPCPATPATPPAAPAATPGAAACAVWNREVEFAQSVHDHDARAFAEHVHPGALFVGDTVLEGREAIVAGWKGLLTSEKTHMVWHPTSVLLTGDPHVALSRGPYWMEIVAPGAPSRFLTGRFQSVWVQDTDGAWRVTIDGGTADPVPATEAEIAKIKASIPAQCPAAG